MSSTTPWPNITSMSPGTRGKPRTLEWRKSTSYCRISDFSNSSVGVFDFLRYPILRAKPLSEYHWSDTASRARETELGWRVKENTVDTVISFIWCFFFVVVMSDHVLNGYRTWIPSATALTSFLCYTLVAGQRLTVSKAFTSLALFSQLQEPMTALPGQFFAMLHAYISPIGYS
jgi:hypothetical protein